MLRIVRLRVEDHHAVGAVLQNRRQPPPLVVDALVKLRVMYRNRGLIGEALQHLHVVGRRRRHITSEK